MADVNAHAPCIIPRNREPLRQGSDESFWANEEQRAAKLVGTKMSGKSFRVSDGDWICPDKKYVQPYFIYSPSIAVGIQNLQL